MFILDKTIKFKRKLKEIKQKNLLSKDVTCRLICQDNQLRRNIEKDFDILAIRYYKHKQGIKIIDVKVYENYPLTFFNVLKQLITHPFIEDAMKEFTPSPIFSPPSIITPINSVSLNFQKNDMRSPTEENSSKELRKTLNIHNIRNIFLIKYLLVLFFLISVTIAGAIIFFRVTVPSPILPQQPLPLPDKSVLLPRTSLLKRITKSFSNKTGISTVVLLGCGGAGKTTLARMWGQSYRLHHPKAIVFPINAQDRDSLSNSFKELAALLAKFLSKQAEVERINRIKNEAEKEKARLSFIQDGLKISKGWVLLYDNLEDLENFASYLPVDGSMWGQGKVLITTQNSHIESILQIPRHNIIKLDALTEEEAVKLFTITRGPEFSQSTYNNPEKIRRFLKSLPPFPLDISVAAQYIQHHSLSYQTYLKELNQQSDRLSESEKELLVSSGKSEKEAKTRYSIIKMALERILEENKYFKIFLLITSFIDCNNIPIELLEYKSDAFVVRHFLDALKKYSLVTENSRPNEYPQTFSLHRNIQNACKTYLKHTLQLTPHHLLLKEVGDTLTSYMKHEIVYRQNFSCMKLLSTHGEHFVQNERLNVSESIRGAVASMVGSTYYHLGETLKAKDYLEKSYTLLPHDASLKSLYCWTSAYLGLICKKLGDFHTATLYFEQSIQGYKTLNDREQEGYARVLSFLGSLYLTLNKFKESETLLVQSTNLYRKSSTYNNSLNFPVALIHLGWAYREQGEYQQAQAVTKEAVEKCETHPGLETYLGQALKHLGSLYIERGFFEEAKNVLEKAANLYKKHNGKTGRKYINFGKIDLLLGQAYVGLGRYREAKKLAQRAEQFFAENHSDDPGRQARGFALLGDIYRQLGLYPKAQYYLKKSKALHLELYGKGNLRTARVNLLLGKLYIKLAKYIDAEKVLEDSLPSYQTRVPNNHPYIGELYVYLGETYTHLGDLQKSQKFLEEGRSILKERGLSLL